MKRNFKWAFSFYGLAALLLIAFAFCYATPPLARLFILIFVCAFIYFGSRFLCAAIPKHTERIMKISFLIFFALYLALLLTFLFFDSYFERDGLPKDEIGKGLMRLTPFATIGGFAKSIFVGGHSAKRIATNLLGNLVAFMPLSFFLPLFLRRLRRIIPFTLSVMLFVTLIELAQYVFSVGVCDIDDLILNTFGAIIAFYLLKIPPIRKMIDKITLI